MAQYIYSDILSESVVRRLAEIKNPPVIEAKGAFIANIDRAHSLLRLPGAAYLLSMNLTISQLLVYEKERGALNSIRDAFSFCESDPEGNRLLVEHIKKNIETIRANIDGQQEGWRGAAELLSSLPDSVRISTFDKGTDAVLSSVIIGVWAAFETMAGDLWEKSLNYCPKLGFVALGAEPSPDETNVQIEDRENKQFQIPIRLLRDWNYDLKCRMGTALREKWDFQRRAQVIDAYKKTFGKENYKNIESVFSCKEIKWMASLRNVLVHRSGIADYEFTRQVRDHPTLCNASDQVQSLLDVQLVTSMASSTVDRGIDLMLFVDHWLSKNKE